MDLVDFKPCTALLITGSESYQRALTNFKRSATAFKALDAPMPDGLDARSERVIKAVTEFLTWTRTYAPEQWKEGVPLTREIIIKKVGYNKSPITFARRSCLKKVKIGARRIGDPDQYTLHQPAIASLAKFLLGAAAIKAAEQCTAMEQAEMRFMRAAALDETLNRGIYLDENEAKAYLKWKKSSKS